MSEVLVNAVEDDRTLLNLTDQRIAAAAEQPAHSASLVTVVNHQRAIGRAAEEALAALGDGHRFDLVRRQPVLPHQPRAKITGPSGVRVAPAPFSKPLVAPLLISLRVLPGALIAAALAVRPQVPPGLRELVQGQRLAALGARLHAFSVTCRCDNARPLDQPCHADVLLELANGAQS